MDKKTFKKINIINQIIVNLGLIRDKLALGQEVTNDDWIKLATLLRENMALFMYNNNEKPKTEEEKVLNDWHKLKPLTLKDISLCYNEVLCFYYNNNDDICCGWMGRLVTFDDRFDFHDDIDLSGVCFNTINTINIVSSNKISPHDFETSTSFDGQIYVARPTQRMVDYYNKIIKTKI